MRESGEGFGWEVMRQSKFNKFKPVKRKLFNMMAPNFLYSNSYHFQHYYYYHSYFLSAHSNCVRIVLLTNSNIVLVYKKSGTIIFNNSRFFFIFQNFSILSFFRYFG